MGSESDRFVPCPDCGGTGEDGALHPCDLCNGEGVVAAEPEPRPVEPPAPAQPPRCGS